MKESDYVIVGNRAIHMIGAHVAVVRFVDHAAATQNIIDPSYAFIDFVTLRQGRTGKWFMFKAPFPGGFGTDFAKTIAAELLLAVEFIAGGG